MPGKNGFELLKDLTGRSESRSIPVIFLTAHSEKKLLVQGLRAGLDDYVTKPCDSQELALRIEAVVRRANQLQTPAGSALYIVLNRYQEFLSSDRIGEQASILKGFARASRGIEDAMTRSSPATCFSRIQKSDDVVGIYGGEPDEKIVSRFLRAANRMLGTGHMLVPVGGYLERRSMPVVNACFFREGVDDAVLREMQSGNLSTQNQLFYS